MRSPLPGLLSRHRSQACCLATAPLKDHCSRPACAQTVLIYLSTQTDAQGGHTIFPALPRADAPPESAALSSYATAVRDAFWSGRRALGCRGEGGAGCGDAGGVVGHAEAECKRALSGGAHGVAVRAQEGSALVFWSEHADGSSDATMWHTACNARALGKHGRWVMQKFKRRMKGDARGRLGGHEGSLRQQQASASCDDVDSGEVCKA